MEYNVKTQHYEGPLDLLLSLIQEQKLDITMVSLSEITDAYLDYIAKQENISLSNLADFLSVAAKLVLIKSKALLPLLQFDQEEESDIHELERQLAALKAIKDIIPRFQSHFEHARPHYARKSLWGSQVQFLPPPDLTSEILEQAFLKSLNAIPKLDDIEEKIITDVISLEKRIAYVQQMVSDKAHVIFSQILSERNDTTEVVVSFLALLELVKQKVIVANQEGIFNDIILQAKDHQLHKQSEKI